MNDVPADHLEWEDAVGSYLLGALPTEEVTAFEVHLRACSSCRDELARLRLAAEALPASAPPVSPPPELKDRIMRVVRSEAELLSAAGAEADAPAPRVRPPRRRWRWRWPWVSMLARPAVAWGAAGLLLLGGGLVGFALRGSGGSGSRTVVAQVDRSAAPRGAATLRVSGDNATLDVRGLRNPPGRRVYQVWVMREGRTAPEPTNALFTVRSNGTASVAVPGGVKGVRKVLVTDEPPGGSEVPSRQPVISASPA